LRWLDWFWRPQGIAYAGSLAATALAVVLGTKIYQESLKQAAQPLATEEIRPAAPSASVTESESRLKAQQPPALIPEEKTATTDMIVTEKLPASPAPQKERTLDSVREKLAAPAPAMETAPPAAPLQSTAISSTDNTAYDPCFMVRTEALSMGWFKNKPRP
jgi:hypothetical protein